MILETVSTDFNNIINTVSFLFPIVLSVYKLFLPKPITVTDNSQVPNALESIKLITPEEIVAAQNVTPPGAQSNYTAVVKQRADGDTDAVVHVAPLGLLSATVQILLSDRAGGKRDFLIMEPIDARKPNLGRKIFGEMAFRPKGQKVW